MNGSGRPVCLENASLDLPDFVGRIASPALSCQHDALNDTCVFYTVSLVLATIASSPIDTAAAANCGRNHGYKLRPSVLRHPGPSRSPAPVSHLPLTPGTLRKIRKFHMNTGTTANVAGSAGFIDTSFLFPEYAQQTCGSLHTDPAAGGPDDCGCGWIGQPAAMPRTRWCSSCWRR
jgi:hypothetical protein